MSKQEEKKKEEAVAYSPEFLAVVADTTSDVLLIHLKEQGVSETALRTFDNLIFLMHARYITKHRELHMESITEHVSEILPRLTVDIAKLGGVFPTKASEELMRAVLRIQSAPL